MAVVECAKTITDLADLWCRMDAHEGQAAWLQAVLTPISLVLAVLAIAAPERLHRRQQLELRTAVLVGAATTAAAGAGTVKIVHELAMMAQARPAGFHLPRSILEPGVRTMRDFPIHTLVDGTAAMAMHSMRLLTDSALDDADELVEFAKQGNVPDQFVAMLKERADHADREWRTIADLAEMKPGRRS